MQDGGGVGKASENTSVRILSTDKMKFSPLILEEAQVSSDWLKWVLEVYKVIVPYSDSCSDIYQRSK